ncbi:hypothetical protein HmCmsJML183_04405 [Escherichia coli]|nr:hypothetical protein HmCmsJML183_04405 [Escherichia coli]
MDRTTTGIFHAALLVSCSMNSVLQATDRTVHEPAGQHGSVASATGL